jgi:hypothetical protein
MKISTSISTFLLIIVLISCDNKEEYFESLNIDPQINIVIGNETGTAIVDSVKLSTANNFYTKEIQVVYQDSNRHVSRVAVRSTTDDVFLIQEDTVLIGDRLELASDLSDTIRLTIFSFNPGFKEITFEVIDEFENTSEATLDLIVFINLVPIVEYDYLVDTDNKFIYFDLRDSFDPDSIYGGDVVSYEINFSGEEIVRSSGEFTVIYSDDQSIYDVNFTVQDNDGSFSFVKTERIRL